MAPSSRPVHFPKAPRGTELEGLMYLTTVCAVATLEISGDDNSRINRTVKFMIRPWSQIELC